MDEPFQLASARTNELDEDARAAIVQICIAAHENPDFKQLFSFLPPDGLHALGYTNGQLASHAVVTTRWLQPAGLPLLKTAYVDAVSTAPEFQGRGCGSAVMRYLAGLVSDSHEIACLETDRETFYTRLGWEIWRGPLAGRSEQGLVPTPDQTGIMILRFAHTPALNLEGLLTIECQPGRIW